MYVCVYVYMCIYIFETIIQMTCFQAVFYNQKKKKNTLCCIQNRMYNDCVEYDFQKKMEVDLLLWHVYYFSP